MIPSIRAIASLRSSTRRPLVFLVTPRMRSATPQSRCFAYVGPSTWNGIPQLVRLELQAPRSGDAL